VLAYSLCGFNQEPGPAGSHLWGLTVPSRLAVVRAVASALGPARTEDEVASAVLHGVGEHLGAVTASLWLLTPDRSELVLSYERNADPAAVARFARIPMGADLPGPRVVATGEPYFVRSRAERDELWPAVAGTPSPSEALVVLPLAATGESLGVVAFGFPEERHFDDHDRMALLAVADQCATALDRARLYSAARADAEANHLLARVSAAAGGHRWAEIAEEVAAVCTDGFVDTCAVYLREGSIVRRIAGVSRSFPQIMSELVDRFPTPSSSGSANATAIRTNTPIHVSAIDHAALGAASPAAEYESRARQVQLGDMWMFPLTDGRRTFGSMLMGRREAEAFSPSELRLAGQVADRTAAMLLSATEFAEQRAAVDALHDVLLPAEVPRVPGFDVAACYVPVSRSPHVGGDWWDALPLPDGRVALVVGDVAGHGTPAVAVMGQLRNAMRARLVAGVGPAAVLAELSALLDWTAPDVHATAVLLTVEPSSGAFSWASAGHPPPLLAEADGSVHYLDGPPGPPLGVWPRTSPPTYDERSDSLAPGTTVYLYSDGLIEGRQRPVDVGMAALAEAVGSSSSRAPLQVRCEELVASLAELPEDDICLLAACRVLG
jgi:serine phosphatase RsbU (regulator of sigma subunit)